MVFPCTLRAIQRNVCIPNATTILRLGHGCPRGHAVILVPFESYGTAMASEFRATNATVPRHRVSDSKRTNHRGGGTMTDL